MEDGNSNDYTQHIASNGTGHQHYYGGRENQIITGSGTINNYNGTFPNSNNAQEEIIQALYTSPYLQRKNRNPDRVIGTCEWFLNHDDFRRWQDNVSSSMLWVSANPGCGKSVLAKCLVDELKTTELRTTCYFFFKDDFEDQKSARSALSCILHQLFTQREDLFSAKIMKRFKSYKTPVANSYYELWELWDILVMASKETDTGEIICILDAFDECENQERQDLARIVREFYVQSGNTKEGVNLKFLITSRPYDSIRRDLISSNLEPFTVIHLRGDSDEEAEKIAKEISLYIMDRVSRVQTNLELTKEEVELLRQGLGVVPNQTYLWVYLTLEWIETEIHNKISEMEIRKAISILPRTVDEAYDKILSKSTNVDETKKLLHIVVAAERPLTLKEMDLALTLQQDHKSYKDLDQRPSDRLKKYIRDLCGLFVNVKDEKVYLLHQTAKEFLVPGDAQDSQGHITTQRRDDSQSSQQTQLVWRSSLIASESHRILFKVCIWNLLFTEIETCPLTEQEAIADYLRENLFLEYSARNWVTHFRGSCTHGREFRKELQQVCDTNSTHCLTWFRIYWGLMFPGFDPPLNITTLIVASYCGIETLVRLELESPDVGLDVVDSTYGRSALSYAAEFGFESIVKLLIKGPKINFRRALKNALRLSFSKGATVDNKDKGNRTPLAYASLGGHLSIVQILAKAGARADLEDEIGATPISYALCTGRQDIANELTKGARITSVDEIRDGLLLSATESGRVPIVKRMLDSGADTEAVNKDNMTPLVIAIRDGHIAIAQLLIDKGAAIHPDKGDYRCFFKGGSEMADATAADDPVNARDLFVGLKSNSSIDR